MTKIGLGLFLIILYLIAPTEEDIQNCAASGNTVEWCRVMLSR